MSTLVHAQRAFSRISHRLPSSATTVLDYGCRDGWSTQWLAERYPIVLGFDTTLEHAGKAIESGVSVQVGDVCDPQLADVIYVGHVMEVRPYFDSTIERVAVINNLRKHCQYLVLGVHTSEQTQFFRDILSDCMYHEKYGPDEEDSVTLLRGYLCEP